MSNRLTTWELKAVDNLPDLIGRMQKIVDLMQQQAALSASSSSAIQGQLSNLSSSYNNLQKQMQGVTTVQQQQVTATNQQAAATRQMQQQYESLRSTAVSLTAIMAGVFSASKAKEFLSEVIDANTRVNLFSKSLEAMLKNKQLAEEVSAYALDLAQRSPLKVEQIMEVTQRLIAMGAEGNKITTYLEMLGEISSVVGTQKLPLIAKALLDVQNKQKLYAQEVRQFTDNGVPLYQLLADSMDLPIKKVKQMAEQHEISFAQVEKALLDATKQGGIYYGSQARNAEELGGKLSNLSDVVFLAKAKFGEFIKEGLGNAITATSNFIKSITATDAAMERTINAVKAVTAAVVTYVAATRGAALAMAAWELITKAVTIAYGTAQLAIRSLTAMQNVQTASTLAATTAARTFWAVLAANPLGLVIAAVGIATTAYYTWRATTAEMSKAQEAMNEKIRGSIAPMELARVGFMNLAKEVLNGSMNAEQKYNALEKLRKQYPGLLKEVSDLATAEKWLSLNGVEVNTNLEYRNRKFEELKEKYPLQLKGIDNLADAEKKLSALMRQVNNDFQIRIKLLENEVRTEINNEAAIAAVREKVKLEGQLATAKGVTYEVTIDGGAREVASEKKVIEEKIKNLDITIKKTQQYNQNIAYQSERLTTQINEDWTAKTKERIDKEADADDDANKEKKAKAILTAKQIAVALGEIQQVTLEDQIKLIEAQKKLDIERVNHSKLTKEQAIAAIKAIGEKAEADTLQLIYNNRIKIEAVEMQHKDKVVKISAETVKSKKKDEKELLEYIRNSQKEEQKLIEETSDIQKKSRAENMQLMLSYLGSLGGAFQDVARIGKKVIDDIDLIGGGALTLAKQQHESAVVNAQAAETIFGQVSKQATDANLKVAETGKNLAGVEAAASTATLGIALMAFDVMKNVVVAINQSIIETNNAIIQAYETVKQANTEFYNTIIKNSEEAFGIELENFRGTSEQRNQIIEDHYAKQKEYAEGRELVNLEATRAQQILELDNQLKANLWGNAAKDLANIEAAYYNAQAFEEQMRQEKFQREVDNARQIRDAKIAAIQEEFEKYKDLKEAEIDLAQEAADAKIDALNLELDRLKDNYNQQVDAVKDAYAQQLDALKQKQSEEETALRATYDLKQQLLEQGTNDEIEAIAILDRTRNEALERYRIAEVDKLIATRDRILATLTNEDEKRQITEEYDRKIKGVHDEVEEAKLDKTKGISLATKQLRTEEKDESIRLKGEEKTEIQRLDDEYQVKFKDLANERDKKLSDMAADNKTRETELKGEIKRIQTELSDEIKKIKDEIANKDKQANDFMTYENQKYRNFVIESNQAMLESQKQMAIAQIKAEIAILKGKRNIFNSGRINAAIGDMENAIRELEGIGAGAVNLGDAFSNSIKGQFIAQNKSNKTPFNSDTMQVVTEAYDRAGNAIALTYTDEDREFVAYDKSGNAFKVRNATGFVEKTGEKFFAGTPYIEGIGYPDGRDTVPAMVNKGERVMQTHLNELIGGREVSNEALAAKALFADRVLGKVADIRGMLRRDTFLAPLPSYMLQGSSGASDLDALAAQIVEAINKPSVSINVTPRGLSVREKGQRQQNETYYENTGYNRKW